VKYKKLVGGGLLKIVNQTVPEALQKLGYSSTQSDEIIDYIDKNDTIEGAPGLKDEHLASSIARSRRKTARAAFSIWATSA
jgi:ribonucleoside-diphosphate reductase alpha chain